MEVVGSLFKYWNERSDEDGAPLFWPGGPGGYPVRGKAGPITQEEFERMPLSYTERVRTFDLKNEEELEAYRVVREKAANQYYIIQERRLIEDKNSGDIVKVYMEWLEPSYTAPATNETPLPKEGRTYAVNGTNDDRRANLDAAWSQADPHGFSKLAGVSPRSRAW